MEAGDTSSSPASGDEEDDEEDEAEQDEDGLEGQQEDAGGEQEGAVGQEEDAEYQGYVVGARQHDQHGLQHLVFWDGCEPDACTWEPADDWECNTQHMDLDPEKLVLSVFVTKDDKMRKCRLIKVVDDTHLEVTWSKRQDKEEEKQFVLDLVTFGPRISEWSLYG